MAEIRLTNINKVYPNGTHAVHDVNLHIADGEFMIMVGPSGCAKSTILRMIAGLEVPTSGTIEIGGRVMNDAPPKDRDIAMVFQSYALYPHMTVRDNMAFGLRLRKMPEQEINQRVAEAARILGLESLLDRLPRQMSGGQRQRVAMGRAIVREPQSFLMDEPLSNLDAKLRVQMRTEIAKLHQRLQTTTVYVTHDQVEAMTLGQRICILRRGVIQQVASPSEVYAHPANIFVGGFIGSPGMNFLMGTMLAEDGRLWLQLGGQTFALPDSVASRYTGTVDGGGSSVVVGIRPEHLHPVGDGDAPHGLAVQVDIVESLGSESFAYFRSDVPAPDLSELSDTQASATSFVARLNAGVRAQAGSTMLLAPDFNHVHLFDPTTQLTLLAPMTQEATEQLGDAVPDRVVLPTQAVDAALAAPVEHVVPATGEAPPHVAAPAASAAFTVAASHAPAAPATPAAAHPFARSRPQPVGSMSVPRPGFAPPAAAEVAATPFAAAPRAASIPLSATASAAPAHAIAHATSPTTHTEAAHTTPAIAETTGQEFAGFSLPSLGLSPTTPIATTPPPSTSDLKLFQRPLNLQPLTLTAKTPADTSPA